MWEAVGLETLEDGFVGGIHGTRLNAQVLIGGPWSRDNGSVGFTKCPRRVGL